eukprot:977436-Amorphochlora_amoeboformis.AAC.1
MHRGCKRLPTVGSGQQFEISKNYASVDGMPQAHTCFFEIDLPTYTSKPIMRKQILYAIMNCVSIDEDNDVVENPTPQEVDREEWARLAEDA